MKPLRLALCMLALVLGHVSASAQQGAPAWTNPEAQKVAIETARQRVELARQAKGRRDTTLATALSDLGDACRKAGQFGESEKALREALQKIRLQENANALRMGAVYTRIGQLYLDAQRPQIATLYLDSAIQSIEPLGKDFEAGLIEPLTLIAAQHYAQQRYAAAEQTYQRVMRIQEEKDGYQSLGLAHSLNNLGGIYLAQSNAQRALGVYSHALNMQEAILGPRHPATATTLTNIGAAHNALGDFEAAERYLRSAYDIRAAKLPADDPMREASIDNLVSLYVSLSRLADAEKFLGEVQKALENQLHPSALPLAGVHDRWAGYYLSVGKAASAEEHLQRALKIREHYWDETHPAISITLYNIGKLQNAEGRHAQAAITLNRALNAYELDVFGHEDAVTAILAELFTAEYAQSQLEAADAHLQALLELKTQLYGDRHPSVAEVLRIMEHFYRETDQVDALYLVQIKLKLLEE